MCGIVGYWQPQGQVEPAVICAMTHRLYHRGPDDGGLWTDPAAGLALGHRRLAVQDLSPTGSQPMCSADGRWVLVYNGEIYNYAELRRQLESEGYRGWRGSSDTEVLLEAIAAWGMETALQRAAGMFAFAAWDRQERRLYLARDRMGEKPLYYGWQGDAFLFASELNALTVHPNFEGAIDRAALRQLLLWGYIPTPYTIYKGIAKLPPGTFLVLRNPQAGVCPSPQPYWSLWAVAQAGATHPFEGTEQAALERVEATLRQVVRQQMVADVPVGAFLSGGIDSSLVVALMQAQSSQPVHTFTIGFEDKSLDEAPYARAVARYLGTDHHEVYLSAADALASIPKIPLIYDEPFADSSQIPTALVAQQARRRVKVVLTGDGGDESTGGYYEVYRAAIAVHDRLQRLPNPLRSAAAALLKALPSSLIAALPTTPFQRLLRGAFSDRQRRLLYELLTSDARLLTVYRILRARWRFSETIVIDAPPLPPAEVAPAIADPYLFLMAVDSTHYLPDDPLVKVDRASMFVALETRAPLLDHRMVELLWQMPLSLRIRDGAGKWLLRQLLYRHVPRELVDRPKQGFAIPLDNWLRGPLREWAETLLHPQRLQQEGFLYPERIQKVWQAHLRGEQQWGHLLWPALMFQAWQENARLR